MPEPKHLAAKAAKTAAITMLLSFTLLISGYYTDPQQFFFSYLVAFVFWLSIALGGLFLLMVHHLTGAVWSVVLRRLLEIIQSSFLLLLLLFLPVLFGLHHLYHWSHEELVSTDHLLKLKSPYLNPTFFILRSLGYFLVWIFSSRRLLNKSLAQDRDARLEVTPSLRRTSAGSMILFAFSVTFASFDWLMSLDPHWYSTIFGIYFFAGCVLACLAFLICAITLLQQKGILIEAVKVAHWHDLGRLLFSFTIFWAYMAFSQYFLIWYGNIPEETVWYLHRWHDGWKVLSLLLVLGHFVLPFLFLMTSWSKRNSFALAMMSVWLLLMHWIDLFWLIMPANPGHTGWPSWQDPVSLLAIGSALVWLYCRRMQRHPLLPINDPRLAESIAME